MIQKEKEYKSKWSEIYCISLEWENEQKNCILSDKRAFCFYQLRIAGKI